MQEQIGGYSLDVSGGVPTPSDMASAEKLLARLLNDPNPAHIQIQSAFARLGDGTTVRAQVIGSQRRLTIVKPVTEEIPWTQTDSALWIPHGFVFTPGNDVSPKGWGLPVVPVAGVTDAFDPTNIDPGLSVARWTAAGTCAQVLLTNDNTDRYPDPLLRRLPIGFDQDEWTAATYQPPGATAWHALRPRFNDFTWDTSHFGARQSTWAALVTQIGKALSPPFLGYYDDAQLVTDYFVKYGANQTAWPPSYNSTTARSSADGIPLSYNEVAGASAATVADMASALGPSAQNGFLLDVGFNAGNAATLRSDEAWIAAGNVFWHPTDPTLPTLSWFGYPAQNLPNWLVTGGWTGATGGPIFPLEGWWYEWRGQTRYVYSKRLYAMGRCIGVLPETLISAAVRVETLHHADGSAYQVNRVIAITWNPSAQFGNSTGIAYFWSFNVWCVDFPRDGTIPLHVTAAPNGAYNATSNPTGWQQCGTFIAAPQSAAGEGLGGLPDTALWQMWRFNGDGSKAIAAFGVPPYKADWGPQWAQELTFSAVAPGALTVTAATAVTAPANGTIVAADYDVASSYVWVANVTQSGVNLPTPEGPTDGVAEMFEWSKGGTGEVSEWAGSGFPIPDKWVLDARDGAMVLTDHWFACPSAQSLHQIRITRNGARVATDTVVDTVNIAVQEYTSTSYLDRLNASYVSDRSGNWMIGYDFGVTVNSSPVYATTPVCGQAAPAITGASASAHFGSHWISSAGDPQQLAQISGSMRAFPLGVV